MVRFTDRQAAGVYFSIFACVEYAAWLMYRLTVTPVRATMVGMMLAIVSIGFNGLLGQLFAGLYLWADPRNRAEVMESGVFSVWRPNVARLSGFVLMSSGVVLVLPVMAYLVAIGAQYEVTRKVVLPLMFAPSVTILCMALGRRMYIVARGTPPQ
jgi:hypothetical protein